MGGFGFGFLSSATQPNTCSRVGASRCARQPRSSKVPLELTAAPPRDQISKLRGPSEEGICWNIFSMSGLCDAPNPQHGISEASLPCAGFPPADPTHGTWLMPSKNESRPCLDLLVFTFLLCPDLGAELWVILTHPRPGQPHTEVPSCGSHPISAALGAADDKTGGNQQHQCHQGCPRIQTREQK